MKIILLNFIVLIIVISNANGFSNYPNGNKYIMVYGLDIGVDIAAVKKLISSKNIMLTKDPFNAGSLDLTYAAKFVLVVDEKDVTGLAVMDLMHRGEAHNYYNKKSGTEGDRFKEIVEKILLDNNFEIAIKTVQTTNDNTTLRLKNVNTDYSTTFKDAIVTNQKPVVLSRGTHSNLLTWENFGKELATDPKNARDAWLIEMVGGPTIDEDCLPKGKYNCPNYTFSDLKTYYWPALIAGVEKYSGQNQIDYVGYSLGCSAALESLKLYGSSGKNNAGYYFDTDTGTYLLTDLASNPVDTFVAVACPGNFSKLTTFMEIFNMTYNDVFNSVPNHVQLGEIRQKTYSERFKVLANDPVLYFRPSWGILYLTGFIDGGDNRISKRVYEDYYNWVNNASGPKIGEGVSINNLLVIQGKTSVSSALLSSGIEIPSNNDLSSDLIVPNQDSKDTCSNIISGNKYYVSFKGKTHGGFTTTIADEQVVKDTVKLFLTNKRIDLNGGRYEANTNCGFI